MTTEIKLNTTAHNLYEVTFFTNKIQTIVTHNPSTVDQWLTETHQQISQTRTTVGLDVEWKPNFRPKIQNPVATLQLCIYNRCLIYQIKHSPKIPQSLKEFLRSKRFVFVGVGIKGDVEKLMKDYKLEVEKIVDLRELGAKRLEMGELKNGGIKTLAREVLRKVIEKPKKVPPAPIPSFESFL
ncbi:3'-5' exonuclease-like isoform X2 [Mercurialis annua]|uniref:3'-5' exonuclease-like isoform X2 n=1 Tax=Mercurialis annua TaxID=3986 RepID=UPI00215E82FA|nr:3'-5' exonuclease-like isoform X2 [Mercurialis annua]